MYDELLFKYWTIRASLMREGLFSTHKDSKASEDMINSLGYRLQTITRKVYQVNWISHLLPGKLSNTELILDSQEIYHVLDCLGLLAYQNDITGIYLVLGEGDYLAVFITESTRPYEIDTLYHPLPYYKEEGKDYSKYPSYWSEDNPFYLVDKYRED